MPLMQSVRDGHVLLQLSGGLTIFQAAEYKPQILSAVDGTGEMLVLDLSGVDAFDTAGLQLLFLLKREAQALSKQICLSGVSVEVQGVLDMLQLQAHFIAVAPAGPDTA